MSKKRMGLVVSHKNNEGRRALLPHDCAKIKNIGQLFFERGYGERVGCRDEEYQSFGAHIVSRQEALGCDIIVDVKLGDADYLGQIGEGKTLVGWAHAVQTIAFADRALQGNHTVLAWEEIYDGGRYVFYRNREIAGEAAVIHAFRHSGRMPYDAKVAIIGNGQTAKGALRVLHGLGGNVDVYPRKFEALFKQKMFDYDVIVNCVMWDTTRTDRLIYREDLVRFRPGTLIIDVSCDPHLEIETSHPTSIDDPVYTVDGIIHYAVDNTPAMYPTSVTTILSEVFARYVDEILEEQYSPSIRKAVVIDHGHITCDSIKQFRESRGLFCK